MCGRFSLAVSGQRLAEQFQLGAVPDLTLRYNIAPTQDIPVVRRQDDLHVLDRLRWGLVPAWSREPGSGARLINARAETAAEKPAFRTAFARRRCLVPADGFYEWQQTNGGKQPFYFYLRDHTPFAFAGLWEVWYGTDGTTIRSCTILTTTANDITRPVHDRMPVILCPEDYAVWLDPALQTPDALYPLLQPYAGDDMVSHPVSRHVNRPANDDPHCVAPLTA